MPDDLAEFAEVNGSASVSAYEVDEVFAADAGPLGFAVANKVDVGDNDEVSVSKTGGKVFE